ncbi:MAG: phytanoyl-CoA dioxygenase family protein [Bacteroidota bacterium]
MLKRIKLLYEIYNFFHKKDLAHNAALYEKYGIKKKYYSSISSEDFEGIDLEQNGLLGPKKKASDTAFFQQLDAESKQSVEQFEETGYAVIKGFWSMETVARVNAEIERMLAEKEIDFKYGNKLMFAIHKSEFLRELCYNKEVEELLDCLIGGDAQLFQSINFINGSEQKTHSDSIHMTTFPLGGLLGAWIALEPITAENGPLHYYPKSHQLPYYMNRDYDNTGSRFLLGDKGYKAYEEMIETKVEELDIKKKIFTAGPGDLLIWHANLLHGGEPRSDKNSTRKSMVLHYFDANRICYHEITQRPALMPNLN